jgi:cytochrome c peroxidase
MCDCHIAMSCPVFEHMWPGGDTQIRRVLGIAALSSLSTIGFVAFGDVERATAQAILAPLPEPSVDLPKVLLGRRLFVDTRLSSDGTLSCASCHSFDHGGAEPRRTSLGIGGAIGLINSPTVLNASLNFAQFWDGRAADLREQARGPVTNPIEMGSSFDRVVAALNADAGYRAGFAAIYADGITEANIVDAIAEYEAALITPAPFDRFLRGDRSALSADERAGYELFRAVGCTSCHRGPNLGGTMYQRLGVVREYFGPDLGRPLTEADNGRFNVTGKEIDRHRFKVPTLRNVALTSPYLHDGSQETLDEAVLAMARHQLGRDLEAEEVRLVVAFLGALTGTLPEFARLAGTTTVTPRKQE